MKKLLPILIITLLFCSCSEAGSGVDTPSIVIDVSETSLQSSDAGTAVLKFTSSASWNASVVDANTTGNWVDITPKSGGAGEMTLSITATKNQETRVRIALIKITSGNVAKTITVNQPGAAPELSLDKYEVNLTGTSGEFELQVTTNGPWITSGIPDWMSLTPHQGNLSSSLQASYKKNNEILPRRATISFTNGKAAKELLINQLAASPSLLIEPSSAQNISARGGDISIAITSNTSWTVSADCIWVTLSQSTGVGNGNIVISVLENLSLMADVATISFAAKDVAPVSLAINRAGATPTLSISPSSAQNVLSEGGSVAVTISSNTFWSVQSNQTWATVGKASGTGNGSTMITIAPNTTTVADVALITFSAANTSSATLTINRAGTSPQISIDKTNVEVGALAGNFDVAISANASWSVSGAPAWVTVFPVSGSGISNVNISYQANTSTSSRTAVMTFSNGMASKILTLSQTGAAPQFSINPSTAQNISAQGGLVSIAISSNTAWSVSSDQNWAVVENPSGVGNGMAKISVSANPHIISDTANVTFTAAGITPIVLTITRAGASPMLDIDKTTQTMSAAGGNFSIRVTSNGTWNASCADSWVRLSPKNGSGIANVTISCEANASLLSRTAIITITHGDISKSLTLNQFEANATLSINPVSVSKVAAAGGLISVSITSNASWSVVSNQSWAIVETTSGNGNGTTTIRVAANSGNIQRKATVTFSAGKTTVTLDINQGVTQLDDFEREEL